MSPPSHSKMSPFSDGGDGDRGTCYDESHRSRSAEGDRGGRKSTDQAGLGGRPTRAYGPSGQTPSAALSVEGASGSDGTIMLLPEGRLLDLPLRERHAPSRQTTRKTFLTPLRERRNLRPLGQLRNPRPTTPGRALSRPPCVPRPDIAPRKRGISGRCWHWATPDSGTGPLAL